jgi:hypothetical protein
MQENIIREVYYVLPETVFSQKKIASQKEKGKAFVNPSTIVTQDNGWKRVLSAQLPADIDETVLLTIDASYFDSTDTLELINRLKKSGLKVDMIIVNLAEDNPDIDEESRERLSEAAGLLSR